MGNIRKTHHRNTQSKSGEITVKIDKSIAPRLKNYGKAINKSYQVIVREAVIEYLEKREADFYKQFSKDELVKMLLERNCEG